MTPRLFSHQEYDELLARANGNSMVLELLQRLNSLGLILKGSVEPKPVRKETQRKKWRRLKDEVEGKQLAVTLIERNGIIHYEYSYPFVPGKEIRKTTGISIGHHSFSGFRRRIMLPWRFDGDSLLGVRGREFSLAVSNKMGRMGEEMLCPEASNPEKLVQVLRQIPQLHIERLVQDIEDAIAKKQPTKMVESMKRRLLRYGPRQYLAMENRRRRSVGDPQIKSLQGLRHHVRTEAKLS